MATRCWTAILLGGLGIAALVKPGAFFGVRNVFRLVLAGCSPPQRDRLERVLDARQAAEGVSVVPARIMGICGVVTAALEFVPSIDFVLPYALLCLSGAVAFLVRYVQVKRATDRRVALLTRRSPYDSLSPVLIACVGLAFAGTAIYLTVPGYRIAAVALLVFIGILGWIAWRLASSPALIQGVDPGLGAYVSPALVMVAIGCAVAMIVNAVRKFSRHALNGVAS